MTRDEIEAAIDRHGGDLSRWPPDLRAAAEAEAAADPEAARLMAEAAALERGLAETMHPLPIDAALVGRIVARATRPAREAGIILRPTRQILALASAGVIACLAIGFVAGTFVAPDPEENALAALVFGPAPADEADAGDFL